MKVSEGRLGRVFLMRLEEGDVVPDCIEIFAEDRGISHGSVIMLGAIGAGDVVVGPRHPGERPVEPMLLPVDGTHEVVGVGVIAPREGGRPVLHIHAALGRSGQTLTGCLRQGVDVSMVAEVILQEIIDAKAMRVEDRKTGLTLLEPGAA